MAIPGPLQTLSRFAHPVLELFSQRKEIVQARGGFRPSRGHVQQRRSTLYAVLSTFCPSHTLAGERAIPLSLGHVQTPFRLLSEERRCRGVRCISAREGVGGWK